MPSFYLLSVSKQITVHEITYRCGVVGLAKIAIDTARTCGIDDSSILLLQEIWPSSFGDFVGTSQMNGNDLIPHLVFHVGKSLVSKNASVVDDDVDSAKGVDSSFHHCITVFSGGLVTYGLSTILLNLLNHIIWVHQIVDYNGCAVLGEQ